MADLHDLFAPLRDDPAVPSIGLAAIGARARRIRRRRRTIGAGVTAVAAVIAIVLVAAVHPRAAGSRVISPVPAPTTTAAPQEPFSGLGRLAVTTALGVEIIEGNRVVQAPASGASALAWSADGQTLAYLAGQPSRLWLASIDGHGRPLLSATVSSFAWSPTGGTVAVIPDVGGLLVVTTSGRTTTLVGPDSLVTSMQWSPDGGALAYAQAVRTGDAGPLARVYVRALTANAPTLVPYSPPAGDAIILGAWWPNGRGLYLWPDPDGSGSIAADGLDLQAVSLTNGRAVSLGTTLPTTRALAFSPDGSRVVVMTGGSRFIGQDKSLKRCPVGSDQCTPIPEPTGSVSVAPSWSPDGRSLVFVRGASSEDPRPSLWLPTTGLFVQDVESGAVRSIAGGLHDVGDPEFSADSRHVVFQHETGLWLLDLVTGATHQLTNGLAPLITQWLAAGPTGGAIPAYDWHRIP